MGRAELGWHFSYQHASYTLLLVHMFLCNYKTKYIASCQIWFLETKSWHNRNITFAVCLSIVSAEMGTQYVCPMDGPNISDNIYTPPAQECNAPSAVKMLMDQTNMNWFVGVECPTEHNVGYFGSTALQTDFTGPKNFPSSVFSANIASLARITTCLPKYELIWTTGNQEIQITLLLWFKKLSVYIYFIAVCNLTIWAVNRPLQYLKKKQPPFHLPEGCVGKC